MASTKEAAAEMKANIIRAFGPPSAGKRLTKEQIGEATELEAGKVTHHVWGLVESGQLEKVGTLPIEGKRGRAATLYARVAAGNGASEAA